MGRCPMFHIALQACDNPRMADDFDLSALRANLTAIMRRRDVKPTTLSTIVSAKINRKNPSLVKDLMDGTSDVKLSTVYRLAEALNVPVTDLLLEHVEVASAGPRLFVKGQVAAGQWLEAFEWPESEWVALSGRSDINADLRHRFFLRVAGDSMDEIYPDGTYIECVSVFGHVEPRPGRRVVVTRKRNDQLVEATVKELVEIKGQLWLVPRSSNPTHQAFRLDDPGPDIEEV